MDFNELLADAKTKREPKSRWKMDDIIKNSPGPTAQAIREALNDPNNTDVVIVEALRGLGHKVGESSVRRYRIDVLGIK